MHLANECYSMKLDLLTSATVIDDAIRFVYQKSKENRKPSSGSRTEKDKEESNEPDHDEDKDQLEKNKKRKLAR
ncbi:MAG: hypothetical protein ACJ72R_19130 [Nitrososphaeraceae archaeon]